MANIYSNISSLTKNTLQIQQTKSLTKIMVNFGIQSEKSTNRLTQFQNKYQTI